MNTRREETIRFFLESGGDLYDDKENGSKNTGISGALERSMSTARGRLQPLPR